MRLIEKLEGLSNVYFKTSMKHVATAKSKNEATNMLFYTIDILDEAISKGKQVKLHYDEYGTDKKLHHRKTDEGEASTAFAILHTKPPEEIARTRKNLLKYCGLDTLAMVKILEKLYNLCE